MDSFSTLAKSQPLVAVLYPAWKTTLSPNQDCMSEDEGPERHAEPGTASEAMGFGLRVRTCWRNAKEDLSWQCNSWDHDDKFITMTSIDINRR